MRPPLLARPVAPVLGPVLGSVLLLVLATTLGGCGDDDAGSGARASSSGPSSLAELTEDEAAARAVTEAITAVRVANTGTFSAHLEYADQVFDHSGSYRLVPPQQRSTVIADTGAGPVESEAIGADGEYVVRLPADGPVSSTCWVRGTPARVSEVVGLETDPDFERLPGAVVLASTAVGISADPSRSGDVLGSVDLAVATELISPRLPALLGLSGGEPVLAHLEITDGELTGIRVDGAAILSALDEAGSTADPDELARVFGSDTPVDVGLDNAGSKVVIESRRPASVIDLDAPGAARRLAACRA